MKYWIIRQILGCFISNKQFPYFQAIDKLLTDHKTMVFEFMACVYEQEIIYDNKIYIAVTNGTYYYEIKKIVLYKQKDMKQLLMVLLHELGHYHAYIEEGLLTEEAAYLHGDKLIKKYEIDHLITTKDWKRHHVSDDLIINHLKDLWYDDEEKFNTLLLGNNPFKGSLSPIINPVTINFTNTIPGVQTGLYIPNGAYSEQSFSFPSDTWKI